MPVVGHDLLLVQGDYITADLILWRRYRAPTFGLVERMLDDNPRMAKIHRETPFLPVGTMVRIPFDPDLMAQRPRAPEKVILFGGTSETRPRFPQT